MPLLVQAVANHERCIHNACLAMKCLEAMVLHSPITRKMLRETDNLGSLVEKARLYGYKEHFKLEKAAHTAIEALRQNQVIF